VGAVVLRLLVGLPGLLTQGCRCRPPGRTSPARPATESLSAPVLPGITKSRGRRAKGCSSVTCAPRWALAARDDNVPPRRRTPPRSRARCLLVPRSPASALQVARHYCSPASFVFTCICPAPRLPVIRHPRGALRIRRSALPLSKKKNGLASPLYSGAASTPLSSSPAGHFPALSQHHPVGRPGVSHGPSADSRGL